MQKSTFHRQHHHNYQSVILFVWIFLYFPKLIYATMFGWYSNVEHLWNWHIWSKSVVGRFRYWYTVGHNTFSVFVFSILSKKKTKKTIKQMLKVGFEKCTIQVFRRNIHQDPQHHSERIWQTLFQSETKKYNKVSQIPYFKNISFSFVRF